jgi:hypothetical protein
MSLHPGPPALISATNQQPLLEIRIKIVQETSVVRVRVTRYILRFG